MLDIEYKNEHLRTAKFNSKTVKLERRDPHSLWFFVWDAGEPPANLSGAYTNPGVAFEHLDNYVQALEPVKKRTAYKEI